MVCIGRLGLSRCARRDGAAIPAEHCASVRIAMGCKRVDGIAESGLEAPLKQWKLLSHKQLSIR